MAKKPAPQPTSDAPAPDPGTPRAMINKPAVNTANGPKGPQAGRVTDTPQRQALIRFRHFNPKANDEVVDQLWASLSPQARADYLARLKQPDQPKTDPPQT